jgi:hypothetical protein
VVGPLVLLFHLTRCSPSLLLSEEADLLDEADYMHEEAELRAMYYA